MPIANNAYDADAPATGKLTTALDGARNYGWTVVDMKAEWKAVFAR
jgi:hypothetical protein